MESYPYKELDVSREEIRLVHLKPGTWDDEIVFAISHTSLRDPAPQPSTRLSLTELRSGLPPGFFVKETLSGRFLFGRMGDDTSTSWTHPNSNINPTLYEWVEDECLPGPGYEPRYEALSYTWASQMDAVDAFALSQRDHGKPLISKVQLGGNLGSALRRLRYPEKDRILWIDAICINQSNADERNRQVKRMGRIYSLAHRVVVWLGPGDDSSPHAISELRSLGNQVEVCIDRSIADAPETTTPGVSSPFEELPYQQRTWSSLESLFSCGWFSRVWVTQEIFLANHRAIVYCGDQTLPWVTMHKAMAILQAKVNAPRDVKRALRYQGFGLLSQQERTLPRLLSFTRRRECSLPHDKVYGILSMSSPAITSLITPDYSKDSSLAFMDAFRADLSVKKRLELLPFCQHRLRSTYGPSWVPDWASDPTDRLFFFRVLAFGQASGLSAAAASFPAQSTMEVKGKRCAEIDSVGSAARGEPTDVLSTIFSWEPPGLHETYVSGGTRLDAFLEVVFQGCLQERYPEARTWPSLTEARRWYQARSCASGDNNWDILGYLKNNVANDAVLFTTKEGYFGVSEEGVKQGDIVCTLLGCNLPMILRYVNNNEYEVVGFCYVHGLMHGESLLGPLDQPWQLRMLRNEGSWNLSFLNSTTQESTREDPRLGGLSHEWTPLNRDRLQDDPEIFRDFRNEITGELLNSDPRLLPEALAQRGILLENFKLI